MAKQTVLDNIQYCLAWYMRRAPRPAREQRVIVAHHNEHVGRSIAMLLGLQGISTRYASDLPTVTAMCEDWEPLVKLVDTAHTLNSVYSGVHVLRTDSRGQIRLMIGMSGDRSIDHVELMRLGGFDGHCRRPCDMKLLIDLLHSYFEEQSV